MSRINEATLTPDTLVRSVNGLEVRSWHLAPGESFERDVVGGCACLVVLDGEGTLLDVRGSLHVKSSFIAIRTQGNRLAVVAARRMLIAVIEWSAAALARLGRLAAGLARNATLFGKSTPELGWRLRAELARSDEYADAAIELYATAIALSISRWRKSPAARESRIAIAARSRMERSLRGQVVLASLARDLGCTAAHLSRVFRVAYGEPPSSYILRRRVELGRAMLVANGATVSRVALDLGFHDTSHFSRHFRKLCGLSPHAFQARHRDQVRTGVA